MPTEAFPIKRCILRASREAAWAPIAVVILHSLAGKLFGHEPYVDPVMHFLGGFAIAFFFYRLFTLPFELFSTPSRLTLNLLAFGLACTAALFWEFGEFFTDQWFGTHMQRGLDNTMRDLLLGTSGAVVYLALKRLRTVPID